MGASLVGKVSHELNASRLSKAGTCKRPQHIKDRVHLAFPPNKRQTHRQRVHENRAVCLTEAKDGRLLRVVQEQFICLHEQIHTQCPSVEGCVRLRGCRGWTHAQ